MKLARIALTSMAVAAAFSMSACGTPESPLTPEGRNSQLATIAVSFPDNTKVDCLLQSAGQSAGLECAWGHPSVATESYSPVVVIGSIETIAGQTVRCVTYDGDSEGTMNCDL